MKTPAKPQPKSSIFDIFSDKKKRAHYFSERIIKCNEERLDYPNNTISTGKYNIINFLPKNLFFQFSKLANVYFVIIGMLQLIKQISTSRGTPYIFLPLTVIILVTMFKDLAEDYKRHKSDWEENNKSVKVLKNGSFVTAKWKDVRVGSIIKVEEDQFIPADMLIIQSSGKKGLCYVETKNLDGETNLKQKQAHKDVAADFDTEAKMSNAHNEFKYEKPNDYLYKFVGYIQTSSGSVALSEPNFILRGCSLRNTAFVIGVVAYTGHHTKMMLNSIKAKPKLSKLEKNMNRQIVMVFAVQICFCIFSGLYAAIWYSKNQDNLGYLEINRSGVADNAFYYNFFIRLGNWLLLFTNFVPISLLVTLEMVKLFQGIFMTSDPLMTAQASQIKTTVQSSNLNEELGQVEYIFSDKTGTLTQNLMEFRNLSVRTKSYGDDRTLKTTAGMPQVSNVDFLDQGFLDELNNPRSQNYESIVDCLTLIAVCHTIITEEKNGQMIYNAASPDELALVNFAKFVGAEFAGMDDNNCINVMFKGKLLKFQLLHVLEFNSTRKRMSVIVKQPDGKVVLMTKGADTILFGLMDKQDPAIATTMEHLTNYSKKGLRTLVLAKKVIDNAKYLSWANKYQEASIKIEGRDEAMEELQAEIETDLKLVGATAIDDKLQDEVGITISKIREAGIRLWVLTGDKVETAINIGFSCKLLDNEMQQLEITETTFEAVNASLDEKVELVRKSIANGSRTEFALIISGDALLHAMKPELSKKIMIIAEVCKSVLACRVSPKQKQEIVSLVRREKPHVNTLAIGDGANDVYMITAANVGIGIRGVEGQQAARASDFAIGEFKILRRLLYVYGREAYRRNSYLILYNFYKNMVLVLPQFWFAFVSGFSGMSIYNQVVFQFFNIVFASVPIIIYAVFDEEHHSSTLMNSPHLYLQGIQNKLFNTAKFWRWFFLGVWESAVIAIFSFGALDNNFSSTDGRLYGMYGPGMLVFSIAVWIVNFKILVMSNTFNVLNVLCVFLSMVAYVVVFVIISCMSSFGLKGFFSELFGAQNFYIGSAVCIAVTYFFHVGYSRYENLIVIAKNKSISPEEKAIRRLLDEAPPIQIELGVHHSKKNSMIEECDNSRSEIMVGRVPKKGWKGADKVVY